MNRTSAPSWLATIGMVLAVIALSRPSAILPATAGYRLVLSLPGWVMVVLAAAALAMFLSLVSVAVAAPGRKRPNESRIEVILLMLLLAILAGTGAVARHLVDADRLIAWLGGAGPHALPMLDNAAREPAVMQEPLANLGLTVALAVLAAAMFAFALLVIGLNQPWRAIAEWFRRPGHLKRAPWVDDLASAMSASIHDIEFNGDPRRAVIACYRRCETVLAARRRRRHVAETPREFVHDALTALSLPAKAVRSLLTVFERARFSDLPMTQGDRSIALHALNEILSVLESGSSDSARA
jgi:hypothetical protein